MIKNSLKGLGEMAANETEYLLRAIGEAHMRIGALESMLMLFLGAQSKRDASVANLLKEMAAGEVPDVDPILGMGTLPANLPESQRAEFAARLDQQKKAIRQNMMRLANMYAEHIQRQK